MRRSKDLPKTIEIYARDIQIIVIYIYAEKPYIYHETLKRWKRKKESDENFIKERRIRESK